MATEKDINDLFLNHVNSNAVKTTKSARHQLQDNTLVSPYPGAKEMILIPDITEAINLTNLFELIKNDLKN
ncbi:TPA: transcriptional regulator [Staphylococcus aureus]